MKSFFQFLLLASFFLYVNQSCSSDDSGGQTQPGVTSIILSANNNSVSVGEPIAFTVKTNTHNTVTPDAAISVNGTAINGNTFTPTQEGTYAVRATYNNLTSNTLNVTAVPSDFSSIILTLSDTELLVGESVTFTATGDNGANLTSTANFTVDGQAVNGNSYTPEASGIYYVRARIGSISSEQLSFEASYPAATSIVLEVSDQNAYWGEVVTILVKDNYGQDVTAESTIFVDGSSITSNTITSDVDATFDCQATFEGFTSEVISVSFTERPPSYVRNVLIEDFTGTWCQFCPRVSYAIELVEAETEHAYAVGLHGGASDPYVRVNDGPLKTLIGFQGYPTAMINRVTPWQFPEAENLDQITDLAGTETNIGLALDTTLSGNTITAEVKVNYFEELNDDIELVVYLLEDGLLYDQVNFYNNLYGGQNPIPDFEHNGVLSDLYTNILGDTIPNHQSGVEYTKAFTETVTSEIEDLDNLYLLAFVIEAGSNVCLNAQRVKVGESIDFEYSE